MEDEETLFLQFLQDFFFLPRGKHTQGAGEGHGSEKEVLFLSRRPECFIGERNRQETEMDER